VTTWHAPAKLGIGVSYHPALREALDASGDCIDFIEISPDILCHERLSGSQRQLDYHPTLLQEALGWSAPWPIVVHGLGLSIGTVAGWNDSYIRILDRLHRSQPFLWHSEHLGFLLATAPDGQPLHAGVQLPLPFTEEALDVVVPRATALSRRYGVPFLLENTTYYLSGLPADGGRDEIAFLNDLTERSGCGLLLDLYNLYCNAVNFGFDVRAALSRLRLERVVEIHVAGGTTHDGFLMDVHSDVVPEAVWDLLEWIVPQTPHLAGIVYELLDQALPIVGAAGIRQQLERACSIWEQVPTAVY
jgi:uncharacterized protein (UPF0276 family)